MFAGIGLVLKSAVAVLGGSVCEVEVPVVGDELDSTVVLLVPELSCV